MNDQPPVSLASRRRTGIVLVLAVAVLVPLGASVLYTFPPTEYPFYPRCLFRWLTGLHCPGCGATRCVHALLHGELLQALAYNPLLVLFVPFLAYSVGCAVYSAWTGKRVRGVVLPGWSVKLLVAGLIAFSILRNIDVFPFSLLAPHQL